MSLNTSSHAVVSPFHLVPTTLDETFLRQFFDGPFPLSVPGVMVQGRNILLLLDLLRWARLSQACTNSWPASAYDTPR